MKVTDYQRGTSGIITCIPEACGRVLLAFGAVSADDLWERCSPEQQDAMFEAELILCAPKGPLAPPRSAKQPVMFEVAKATIPLTDPRAVRRFKLKALGIEMADPTSDGTARVTMPHHYASSLEGAARADAAALVG